MNLEKGGTCGKCGICLTVCPVFKVLKEEQASPRARIQLIKAFTDNKLTSSPLLKELISKCLMCGNCAAICPSGVDHESQFMEMRSRLSKQQGERLEIKGLVYLLAKEQRLRLAAGVARLGQEILPDSFQRKHDLGNIPIRKYPRLNRKPFRKTVPEINPPKGKPRGTVLYFTGCATNHLYAETGEATLHLLTSMGYTVIIPQKQTCCSIPMLLHGGEAQAQQNIQQNIDCLHQQDVEAIIVDCPTCGAALKNKFPAMMRKYGREDGPAMEVSAKVVDLMSFVYERLDQLDRKKTATKLTGQKPVTYHTPCHLKNNFTSAARVLEAIPEIEYHPAADSTACCGGGGTFFYEYPEVSAKMGRSKIENARKTGAKIWLTDCPVCRLNLSGQLDDGDTITMMHPAMYLAKLLDV